MIFPQFVIYILIYDYLKFRKDPSITSQEKVKYVNVALAVTLSVYIHSDLIPVSGGIDAQLGLFSIRKCLPYARKCASEATCI